MRALFLVVLLTACSSGPRQLQALACRELGELCLGAEHCCEGSCNGCASVGVGVCALPSDGGAP